MTQLDALLGNAESKAALQAALQAGRLPHAVLLAAPDGCGRGFTARCLAADYLYPQGGPGAHAVMEGQSPELMVVQGEGRSGRILVDQVRAVRSDMFLSALSADGRVVWIKDAQRMDAAPANALLKVLEEPPADVLFILTAHDAAALPLTLRSRCAVYTLAPVSPEECESALGRALPPGGAASLPVLLTAVYGGRIGKGLQVLRNESRLVVLQDALRAAKAAVQANRYELLRIFAGYEGRAEDDRPRREALLSDLADALQAALYNAGAPGLPATLPAPGAAARMLTPVLQAQADLAANASPKLLFTALTVRLASPGLA